MLVPEALPADGRARGAGRLHALQAVAAAARTSCSGWAIPTPIWSSSAKRLARDEDVQGEPFVGLAGQLLTKMIGAMGFSRDDVYICNVIKCRPPSNRNPEPDEVAACEPFLKGQLGAIKPRMIVTLGKFASQSICRDSTPITRLRGNFRSYEGIPVMPTFHPAYLLRTPEAKREAWADLQAVLAALAKLGITPPNATAPRRLSPGARAAPIITDLPPSSARLPAQFAPVDVPDPAPADPDQRRTLVGRRVQRQVVQVVDPREEAARVRACRANPGRRRRGDGSTRAARC